MKESLIVYVIEAKFKGTVCVDTLEGWTDLETVKRRIGQLNNLKDDNTITYCYKPIYVYDKSEFRGTKD